MPDAGAEVDAGVVIPGGGEYWQCWAWEEVSPTLAWPAQRCSPKCSNETLLGRLVFGENNTCEYAPGVFCPTERMTGPSYQAGHGCCIYVAPPQERVEFVPCT